MANDVIKLRFEVANEVQLSRAFQNIADVDDLREPFEEMADDFYVSQDKVFQSEGAFEGRDRWKELSPAYAAWKRRKFPGRKILELTGRMRKAATIRGALENVTRISEKEMVLGLSTPYAIKHQQGIEGILPQRKIIQLSNDQKIRWTRIMHTWLHKKRMQILKTEGVLHE